MNLSKLEWDMLYHNKRYVELYTLTGLIVTLVLGQPRPGKPRCSAYVLDEYVFLSLTHEQVEAADYCFYFPRVGSPTLCTRDEGESIEFDMLWELGR